MTKLSTFILLILLYACGNSQSTKTDTPPLTVLEQYKAFLTQLDTQNIANIRQGVSKYQELFAGIANKATADSAYKEFLVFQQRINNYYTQSIDASQEAYFSEVGNIAGEQAHHQNAETQQKIKELKTNGFVFKTTEGYVYLAPDAEFLEKNFSGFLSTTGQRYFKQWKQEDTEGFVEDMGLTIKPTELAQRIVFWEKFLQENPSTPWTDEVSFTLKAYTNTLFVGLDNTPSFDYEMETIMPEYKEAFVWLVTNHPNTKIGKQVSQYTALLEQNNWKNSAQAKQFVEQFIQ